jgi:hypothetical protein
MTGFCDSLVGEVYVCSGDFASYWSLSVRGVFVLAREIGKVSILTGGSVVVMLISICCVSSSYPPAPNSFLELSL